MVKILLNTSTEQWVLHTPDWSSPSDTVKFLFILWMVGSKCGRSALSTQNCGKRREGVEGGRRKAIKGRGADMGG